MTSFMSSSSVAYASKKIEESGQKLETDTAFDTIVNDLSKDTSRIWNVVKIFNFYRQYGGKEPRRSLIKKISDHFGESVAILTSPGLASMIVFKNNSSSILHLVNERGHPRRCVY